MHNQALATEPSNTTPPRELSLRGILLGGLITLLFTAAYVYRGLKVGLTFATSIPAALISMAVLRFVRGSTILENRILQTLGNRRVALANFLTALAATLAFKLALFAYSVSGAEGASSPWATWPRLVFVLGWDVVSAAAVGTLVTLVAVGVLARLPRIALAWSVTAQAVYALFLLVSYHVAIVVGAPLDKAAIDLMFFYTTESTRTSAALATSALPYVTLNVEMQALAAVVCSVLFFVWSLRRAVLSRATARRAPFVLVVLVILSLVAIPALANTPLQIHTFGLERSPVTMLAGSYLRGPLRALRHREEVIGDPYCLDLRSPVPVDGTNPLTKATARRTNLLLVILESISDRNFKAAPTPMPFLEALGRARHAVRLEQHYTHWPQTMNAEFTVWCSELPHPDYPPITYVNPSIPCVSLSESLKAAGYDTALLLSSDLGYHRKTRFLKHRQFDVLLDRNEMPGRDGAWEDGWGIDERVTTRAVLNWVSEQRLAHPDRPFFAAYNMITGHHPYQFPGSPPGRWLDAEAEAVAHRATLGFVDERLRELVHGLDGQGLLDSTLIAIVSDHGPGSGRGGVGSDASVYEGSVHVPFVLTGPQLKDIAGAVTLPTGHTDVAPTLLGLLGIQPPATMKGRDLTHDSDPRVVIFGTRPPLSQVGVRAGPWKLVHWSETGVNELFDVTKDPDERIDLSRSHRDLAETLSGIGRRWQTHSRNLIENYAEIFARSGHQCSTAPD